MSMRKTVALSAAALCLAVCVGGASAQTAVVPSLPKPGEAPAGSPVAKHGQLSVSGKVIKDKNGNDVTLRGLSLFWSASGDGGGYYSDDVIGWLVHDWRISVIRAAMSVEADGGGGGNVGWIGNKSEANKVKSVIEASIRRGIYVIIDWHSHKAEANTTQAQAFFTEMATAYGAYPNIIYETYNEPESSGWDAIKDYTNSVIGSIRLIDKRNIITIGSPGWSSQPHIGKNDDITNSTNVVYTLHFYANSHSWNENSGYGKNAIDAQTAGRAVLATEFGTCSANGAGSVNEGETTKWLVGLEARKIGWVNWSVTNKPDPEKASIFSSSSSSPVSGAWRDDNKPMLTTSGTYIHGKLTTYNSTDSSGYYPTTAYTVNATAGDGGTVTKNPNKATYGFGERVTIKAVPSEGFEFAKWDGEASGSIDSIVYRVVGLNVAPKAIFAPSSIIKNGHFTANVANWTAGGTGLTISREDDALKAVSTASVTSSANVRQGNLNLTGGRKYELSFRAKATGTATIKPRVCNTNLDRDYMPEPVTMALTAQWQEFKREFAMCVNGTTPISDAAAQFRIECGGSGAQTWFIDDVVLTDVGAGCTSPTAWSVRDVGRTGWSIAKAGAAWQLRGPASGAGAKAVIYDTRGKVVKSMAAADGLTLGKGMPAGSYFLVIKNGAGAEAFRSKITVLR